MKNHIRVDIMISYFLFFIVLFILFFMIVYAIYIFRKLRNKKDDCDEEIKIKDENKIRYLLATIVILFSILYMAFAFVDLFSPLIGQIILLEVIVFNCIKKYTHLERFYHNAKLVVPLIFLFFLYVVIFN